MAVEVLVTEHKSVGQLASDAQSRTVRVFVNRDYNYGQWVPEGALYRLLSPEQQAQYLAEPHQFRFHTDVDVAQKIVDMGLSLFKKQIVTG